MKVNEIFFSIQGESSLIGVPTLFIRFYGCNARCSYCDTVQAQGNLETASGIKTGAKEIPIPVDNPEIMEMSVDQIIEESKGLLAGLDKHNAFICITGGEPLIQDKGELKSLCHKLSQLTNNRAVISIETNGTIPIPWHLPYVYWITDIKTPGSGVDMDDEKIAELIRSLNDSDEIKFIVMGLKDYDWAVDILNRFVPTAMIDNRNVSFSPVAMEGFPNWPRELADRIVEDKLSVRFQLQLHKVVWPDAKRGV